MTHFILHSLQYDFSALQFHFAFFGEQLQFCLISILSRLCLLCHVIVGTILSLKSQRRTVHFHIFSKESSRSILSLSVNRSRKVDSPPLILLLNCRLPTSRHCLQRRGGLAQAGGHYRLLEPQTVNFPRNVIRSYTPACAKPLVRRSAFLYV